jgi:D-alanine-D-alanine ligase
LIIRNQQLIRLKTLLIPSIHRIFSGKRKSRPVSIGQVAKILIKCLAEPIENVITFAFTKQNSMQKQRIAVVMGGDSGEYDISIQSAKVTCQQIDNMKYAVYPVLIHNNEWAYVAPDGSHMQVDRNDFSITTAGEKVTFDAIFIAIHGTPGEDGKLQGYFEMLGIPFTTCDSITSAITFSKYFTNDLAITYGIKVPKTFLLRLGRPYDSKVLSEALGFPFFIKPNKAGSSVGVSKVYQHDEVEPAIQKAFIHDNEVLMQQFAKGRELACGVYSVNGEIKVLPVTEIISAKDFFDYEAKYSEGMAREITPAPISSAETAECHRMTAYLYEKFNCRGIVRFDYFLDNGEFWFLEVNTVPGLSEGSIVPKQAAAAGISMKALFSQLIVEALAK